MRLLNLSIQNIGPFDDARIELLREHDDRPAVTLITGENGTGKSILLDAIRGVFGNNMFSSSAASGAKAKTSRSSWAWRTRCHSRFARRALSE